MWSNDSYCRMMLPSLQLAFGLIVLIHGPTAVYSGEIVNRKSLAANSILNQHEKLYGYGFKGDGFSHPLSSQFSSLTEARAVFPHAFSLSDEFDWAAIQAVINSNSNANGLKIWLPAGVIMINRPIITGGFPIEFEGMGPSATRLVTGTPNIDVFRHGLSDDRGHTDPIYNATFTLRNLGIYVTAKGPRFAINIRQHTDSGGFVLDRVHIGSYSAKFSWFGFVNGRGNTRTHWRDVVMSGSEYNASDGWADGTKVGVLFSSNDNSDHSFVYNFDNVTVGAIENAFRFVIGGTSPGNHGSIEGVQFSRCGGRVDLGAWLRLENKGLETNGWFPPYWVIESSNMEGPGTLLDFDSASEVFVSKNLMFVDRSSSPVNLPDFINFRRVLRANVSDNTLTAFAGASLRSLIRIGPDSRNVFVDRNFFHIDGQVAGIEAGVIVEGGSSNVNVSNNIFDGPPRRSFTDLAPWPTSVPEVLYRAAK